MPARPTVRASTADALGELCALYEKGALGDDEYERFKARILDDT